MTAGGFPGAWKLPLRFHKIQGIFVMAERTVSSSRWTLLHKTNYGVGCLCFRVSRLDNVGTASRGTLRTLPLLMDVQIKS